MNLKLCYSFILVLALISCKKEAKKEPVTVPVEFTVTSYSALGTYDASGKPDNLLPRETVSPAILSFINSTLPNQQDLRKTNPDLLTTKAIADIAITKQSDVFITFVTQGAGAGYTNAFAF